MKKPVLLKCRGFFIETLDKIGYNLYKQIGGYHIH